MLVSTISEGRIELYPLMSESILAHSLHCGKSQILVSWIAACLLAAVFPIAVLAGIWWNDFED